MLDGYKTNLEIIEKINSDSINASEVPFNNSGLSSISLWPSIIYKCSYSDGKYKVFFKNYFYEDENGDYKIRDEFYEITDSNIIGKDLLNNILYLFDKVLNGTFIDIKKVIIFYNKKESLVLNMDFLEYLGIGVHYSLGKSQIKSLNGVKQILRNKIYSFFGRNFNLSRDIEIFFIHGPYFGEDLVNDKIINS